MLIIPAIDLKGGRCVRLWQGKRDEETVYSQDPLSVAKRWKDKGARRLHVVDLDGAFEGRPVHLEVAARIAKELNVLVEFGGGIRDLSTIKEVFNKGIDYAILGSKALNLKFVEKACKQFGDKIIVSIDVRDSKIAIEGWERQTSVQAKDLARDLVRAGIKTIIFTDIARDGTMQGINIQAVRDFATSSEVDIIVSGGISSLEDVKEITRLNNPRIMGMIIGRALYTGAIKLEEAIKIVKGKGQRVKVNEMEFLKEIIFNSQGLVPAIIQEVNTNKVLMMAWMNKEALKKTIDTGKTHFWSRSRQKLWFKGETSGHYQIVKEIYIDCDGDALLIKVEQIKAACHTGYHSCFFRKLDKEGKLKIVGEKVFEPMEVYK